MACAKTLSAYDLLNDSEYMSGQMLNFFKDKLQQLHEEVIEKAESISVNLAEAPLRAPDRMDQGTNEEFLNENYTFQEHENHLQKEIESALQRIDERSYGYCEETGDPIGLKRLLAIPYARYCLKVQEAKEQTTQHALGTQAMYLN